MVVEAIDERGSTVLDVRVSIDGVAVADRLTGLGLNVDPGEHVLRLVLRDGRVRDQRIVMLAGDHLKRISVRFDAVGSSEQGGGSPPSTVRSSAVPTSAWIVGGAGVAALATGVVFGGMALSDRSRFDANCATTRTCDSSDVGSMHTKALVADVSFAVAVGATIATIVLVLSNGREAPPVTAQLAHVFGAPVTF